MSKDDARGDWFEQLCNWIDMFLMIGGAIIAALRKPKGDGFWRKRTRR